MTVARTHPRAGDSQHAGRRPELLVALLALAASFAVYLLWEVAHRGTYLYSTTLYPFDDADEWRYTACSRLVARGYTLFDQVYSAQPPLFFLSLAGGIRVFSDSIMGARAVEIGFGALGLTAAAWLAWELAGPSAAAVTSIVLAISPAFLIYAHTVEAEVPMMALATLSLALAVAYRRTERSTLLVGAGLSLAGAMLIKFFAAEALLPVLWALGMERPRRLPAPRAAALFIAAAGVPVAADLALISPQRQWQQVVELHNRAAGLHLPGLIPPATILREFLTFDAGLTVLAIGGLVALCTGRRFAPASLLFAWVLGTAVMLLLFRPLFPHHAAILSAPLAVCAGAGAGTAVDGIRGRRMAVLLPMVLAALAYCALLPRLVHVDRHTLLATSPSSVTVLAAYVDRTTPSGAFVAADNVQVAERAHRLVPPPLCDPSNVRLRAGYLAAGDLITATRRYHAVLVIATGNFTAVPRYIAWVQTNFQPVAVPGAGTIYRLSTVK